MIYIIIITKMNIDTNTSVDNECLNKENTVALNVSGENAVALNERQVSEESASNTSLENIVETHMDNIVSDLLDNNLITQPDAERFRTSTVTTALIHLVTKHLTCPRMTLVPTVKEPMTNEQVQELTSLASVDVVPMIDELAQEAPHHSPAFNTLLDLIELIKNPPENLLAEDAAINIESAFGYDESLFTYLAEILFGLKEMLDNPMNEEKPLSMGSIKNVLLTLCRRIYVASRYNLIVKYNGNATDAWPFLIVDERLKTVCSNIFLKLYFSKLFNVLIPLYIYAVMPFCTCKHDLVSCNNDYKYPIGKLKYKGLTRDDFYNALRDLKSTYAPGHKFQV